MANICDNCGDIAHWCNCPEDQVVSIADLAEPVKESKGDLTEFLNFRGYVGMAERIGT